MREMADTVFERNGVRLEPEVRMIQQERAISSPIWYTPADPE